MEELFRIFFKPLNYLWKLKCHVYTLLSMSSQVPLQVFILTKKAWRIGGRQRGGNRRGRRGGDRSGGRWKGEERREEEGGDTPAWLPSQKRVASGSLPVYSGVFPRVSPVFPSPYQSERGASVWYPACSQSLGLPVRSDMHSASCAY